MSQKVAVPKDSGAVKPGNARFARHGSPWRDSQAGSTGAASLYLQLVCLVLSDQSLPRPLPESSLRPCLFSCATRLVVSNRLGKELRGFSKADETHVSRTMIATRGIGVAAFDVICIAAVPCTRTSGRRCHGVLSIATVVWLEKVPAEAVPR
jgi:hypothetical protein